MDQLKTDWPVQVVRTCAELKLSGHQAWVVGGAVRDKVMGREPKDYDIATSATPHLVECCFGSERVVPTGAKFGTVTVLDEGMAMEVTTFRADGRYIDGRRPAEVHYAKTIEEDLARRDFTVNAMACDPNTNKFLDPFGGVADILAKRIRAVGDPDKRFAEDGLRPLRACRFASTLDFELHAGTGAAIRDSLGTFRNVSAERKWQELQKLLAGPAASRAVHYLEISGLMQELFPELVRCKGLRQDGKYHTMDVYDHSLGVLVEIKQPDPILRLAALLHDVGKPDVAKPIEGRPDEHSFVGHENRGAELVAEIAGRLKLSGADRDRLVCLVQHHMAMMTDPRSKPAYRRMLRKLGIEHLEDFIALRRADLLSDHPAETVADAVCRADWLAAGLREVANEQPAMEVRDLVVGGREVMEIFGCKPGPLVGSTLNRLLELVLEDPDLNNTRDLKAQLQLWAEEYTEGA